MSVLTKSQEFEHTSAAITAAKAPPWLEAKYRAIKQKKDRFSHLNPKTPYSRTKKEVSMFNLMKEGPQIDNAGRKDETNIKFLRHQQTPNHQY